ncbi:MAG: DUF927 domain-containing protein [Pseudomonadota bacterium]
MTNIYDLNGRLIGPDPLSQALGLPPDSQPYSGHNSVTPHYRSVGSFEMRSSGLFELRNNGACWLADPFEVIGKRPSAEIPGEWFLELQWRDPDRQLHGYLFPRGLLAGSQNIKIRRSMLRGGLRLSPRPTDHRALQRYLRAVDAMHALPVGQAWEGLA